MAEENELEARERAGLQFRMGLRSHAQLLAVAIIGAADERVRAQVIAFKRKLAAESRARGRKLQAKLAT